MNARSRRLTRIAIRLAPAVSAGFGLAAISGEAHAHGAGPAPTEIWGAWTWDPLALLAIAAAGGLYVSGLSRLWRRAGVGQGIPVWRSAAFAGGLLALWTALVSPVHAAGYALLSAHMVQHLLLLLVAAPLLVLGRPLVPALWALPRRSRQALSNWPGRKAWRSVWRVVSEPVMVWLIYAGVLWGWHLPGLYELALERPFVHFLEHSSLLFAALLLWWTIINPGVGRRTGYGRSVLLVFAVMIQGGALGALVAFSGTPLYPGYAAGTDAWGLSPMADQQLAGFLMWIPAGTVWLITAVALFAEWLRAVDRETRRREGADLRPAPGRETG